MSWCRFPSAAAGDDRWASAAEMNGHLKKLLDAVTSFVSARAVGAAQKQAKAKTEMM